MVAVRDNARRHLFTLFESAAHIEIACLDDLMERADELRRHLLGVAIHDDGDALTARACGARLHHSLEPNEPGAPSKARTERREEDEIALLRAPLLNGLAERERDRGGRRI